MADEPSGRENGTQSKVASLIRAYDLEGLGEELERSWTGDDAEKRSLRQLAEYFNKRLLGAEMTNRDVNTLDGEVDNIYRLLTDDEVTSGTRVQTRNKLANKGINVDRLLSDFVSRQAIHTYLTKVRGVTHSSETESGEDRIARRTETIHRLQNRLAVVSEESLRALSNTEEFTIGDPNVFVSIHVHCTECGTRTEIGGVLSDGGCDCPSQ